MSASNEVTKRRLEDQAHADQQIKALRKRVRVLEAMVARLNAKAFGSEVRS